MTSHVFDLIGVGSPIVDSLAQVPDSFIAQSGGAKGGMVMVGASEMAALINQLPTPPVEAPGGSAGNTIAGAARLGLRTSFLGKLGSDDSARFYQDSFLRAGIDVSRFKHSPAPNARCLSLITPDSERTMRTCLGAAMDFRPEEVAPSDLAGCRHAHVEGYVLFNEQLARTVLNSAKQAGCTISLDLASFEVVRASRPILHDLLQHTVDVVFANEEEARAYCGSDQSPEAMALELSRYCQIAAVKLGKDGAILASNQTLHPVEPRPAPEVKDTTGAGDLWAAGFLAGWLRGLDLTTCGKLGAILGAEVVQVIGASLPAARWDTILNQAADLGLPLPSIHRSHH